MLFPNLIAHLYLWAHRWRQRRQLRSCEDWLLRDLGITRKDAMAEAKKPCWRA